MEKKVNKAHLFKDSPYFDLPNLIAAFFGTKYQEADFEYYHEKAATWSEAKGAKKLNWKATINNWMCEALKDGKLVYKSHIPMDQKTESAAAYITNTLTKWAKDEGTVDYQPAWQDLQEKARKGINVIIPVTVYEWLTDTGQLILSKDERIDLFFEAKFEYIKELETSFTPQDKQKLQIMKTEGWGNDKELYESVVLRAKKLGAKKHLYKSIQKQPA